MADLTTARSCLPAGLPPPSSICFCTSPAADPDGYHELQTAFQFLDYGDRLEFDITDDAAIGGRRPCGGADAAGPDRAGRAQPCCKAGCSRGARIRLDKRFPVGGGLGGGSSDAATTLVALNALWQTGLGDDDLAHWVSRWAPMSRCLCAVLRPGPRAWGKGSPLSPAGRALVPGGVPPISVSTAAVFSDPELTRNAPRIKIRAFLSGTGSNDCEAGWCGVFPSRRSLA